MNTVADVTTMSAAEAANHPLAVKAIQQADAKYQLADAYVIDSPEMYEMAGEELRAIATKLKEVEETRLSITRPLDETKRRVMDLFHRPLERLEEANSLLRGRMLEYKREEDRKAAEARAAAERAAELERQRLERERVEAEERARELANQAAVVADAGEAERLRQEADDAAQAAQDAAEAAELAEVAPVALPAVTAPKAAGVSSRQNWKAEVTDLGALVTAAAAALANGDDTLLAYLQANTTTLGQVAKALKAQARIPGVRVYAEEALTVRRK